MTSGARKPGLLPLATALAGLFLTPAGAGAGEGTRFTVRAFGTAFSPAGDRVTLTEASPAGTGERTTLGATEDATGFGVGFAYRLSRRLSVELAVSWVDLETSFRWQALGGAGIPEALDRRSATFQTVAVGVDWHLRPYRRVDVRLGAFVAETKLDDVVFVDALGGRSAKLAFDDDHGFGLKLGFDLPFRPDSPWTLSGDLRYLATILESETPGQDVDLDPLILSIGFGFRF